MGDLVIIGFILGTTSAFFLVSNIFKSKKTTILCATEESRSFFGANPFYIKSSIENFYRANIGLILLFIGFLLQLLGFLFPIQQQLVHWSFIFGFTPIVLITLILLLNKLIRRLVFGGLVMAFGDQEISSIDGFLKSSKLGEKTMCRYEGLYGDYIKREFGESDFDYLKRLKKAIVRQKKKQE